MTTVYTDTSPGSTPFPPTIHHWAAGVFVTSNVGTWSTNTTSDATPLGQVYSNSSNAQNDSVTWDFLSPISAGTYTLTQGIKKASSNGIATFQYSNNLTTWINLTTIDQYSGSTIYPQVSVTGLVIPTAFRYFRALAASKNASSSGYTLSFYWIGLVRTA